MPLALRLGLGVLSLACAGHVAYGLKPWETQVASRHAAGKVATLHDYVAHGLWYGCVFTAVAALLLLVTSRWWLRPAVVEHVSLTRTDRRVVPRRLFWTILAGLLLLALVPRLPRMCQSFWGDEDWAYRDLIGGRFAEAEDGSLRFKRHSWKVTAFWDKGTNNQYAYTLLARVCHDAWKRASGSRPEAFSEAVLRVPSLLAGLGSIAMGALLLRRLGFSRAALLLALLMAIHPWHVRYSSEARGYTMLIFFLLAGIFFLLAALEDGRWHSWVLFGLCEFLALYTWKAAVHPIAAINLSVLVVMLVKRRRDWGQYVRWLVANVAVLMLFVPLFAPAIPQIRRKLTVSEQARGEMGLTWFENVLAQLVEGVDWAGPRLVGSSVGGGCGSSHPRRIRPHAGLLELDLDLGSSGWRCSRIFTFPIHRQRVTQVVCVLHAAISPDLPRCWYGEEAPSRKRIPTPLRFPGSADLARSRPLADPAEPRGGRGDANGR